MKTIYVAECIEAGERFTSTFQTAETNKEKIYRMGQELANGCGGECIKVVQWKPKEMWKIWDKIDNKWTTNTKRSWENFMEKYPNSTRYDYKKKVVVLEKAEEGHIWDCDLTDKENLKIEGDYFSGYDKKK